MFRETESCGLTGRAVLSRLPFREIWAVDFEFIAAAGDNPVPVCLVAWELRSGRKIRQWSDEFGSEPPYPTDEGALFVAYYASAEIGCHLALNWPVPARILDLFAEFRNLTNGMPTVAGNGLVGALAHFGIDSIGAEEKDAMRALILRGGPWTDAEQHAVLDYCETDVGALERLLPRLLPHVDLPRALLRGRYMAAAAQIERNGVPIDVETLELLRRHWGGIQMDLIVDVDRDYGVFEGGTFKHDLFAGWLARSDIPWPRLGFGQIGFVRRDVPTNGARASASVGIARVALCAVANAAVRVERRLGRTKPGCCRHSDPEPGATSRATRSSSSGRAFGCVG